MLGLYGRGNCKEVRRGLKVLGRGHKGPGEARGYSRWFLGVLGVLSNLVCCRGLYAIKRLLVGYRGLGRLQRGMIKYVEYEVNTGGL